MNVKLEMNAAGKFLTARNYVSAYKAFRKIYEEYPNNIWALTLLTKSLVENKNVLEAVPYILKRANKGISKHPSDDEFIKLVNQFYKYIKLLAYNQEEYLQFADIISNSIRSWYSHTGYDTKKIDFLSYPSVDIQPVPDRQVAEENVAVLISGQLRGYENSIESIKQFIGDVRCDVYFVTWDRAGFRDITSDRRSYSHLGRTFDTEFCQLVHQFEVDLTGYIDASPLLKKTLTSSVTESTIRKIYPNSNVKVLDELAFQKKYTDLQHKLTRIYGESEEVFATGINMMKMVYANYQAFKLAENAETKYTHILKLRPDFIVNEEYSLKKLMQNKVLKNGYGFLDSWAGEVSDQFYLGTWEHGSYYHQLWDFWLHKKTKVDDIGNLFKPHKRIKDYLGAGNIPYIVLPKIRKDLDSSKKISKSDHIELIKSDYEYFKKNATSEQIHFFEKYSTVG